MTFFDRLFSGWNSECLLYGGAMALVAGIIVLVVSLRSMKIQREARINMSYIDRDSSRVEKIRDVYLYTN